MQDTQRLAKRFVNDSRRDHLKSQYRFFVNTSQVGLEMVSFPEPTAHQLRSVLRLGVGDVVVILDNSGEEALVELTRAGEVTEGRILSRRDSHAEPRVEVSLFLGALKGRRLETAWQKCTELGVASITPVVCARSVAGAPHEARGERLRDIGREAAEQSGRGKMPTTHAPATFQEVLSVTADVKCLFAVGPASPVTELRQLMRGRDLNKVALLVGPEGGFTAHETAAAVGSGWTAISLGPRILRAETAAIVATSLVMYEAGELRGP